jgi:small redox-active disulfide protein 2
VLGIEFPGPGCANCRKLEQAAREAVSATGVDAQITKVTDMQQIVAYDVLETPGLVIDDKRVRRPGPNTGDLEADLSGMTCTVRPVRRFGFSVNPRDGS